MVESPGYFSIGFMPSICRPLPPMADPQLQIDLARDAQALTMPAFTGFSAASPQHWIQQFKLKVVALLIPPVRAVRLLLYTPCAPS